jgi:eukaryotic-like serine/threonine-protein kinase
MIVALDEHGPRQVGPYRLLGRLGAGGMGQVFLGVDAAGRRAAVKIVHPGLADDPRFRARFAREVAAGRRVRGPWTAEFLDADTDATPPWLATEYVAAPSLDQVVRDIGSVPTDAMARLALGLARALVALHDAGLLHRDVKPSNVLLAGDGPRLIDFGIAQAVDATRLTTTGTVFGTPAFMSPEQAGGGELSTASDVFSLGGVLVFAATGTGPFGTAPPVALLRRVLTAPPDLGALDEPLREVAALCLRRDPAARPTPAQVVERLEPVARERPGWLPASVTTVVTDSATREVTSPVPEARRRLSRRRLLLGGTALIGVGVAAGLFTRWRAPAPAVRWSYAASGGVGWLAVDAGTVFVGTDNDVAALDLATGQSRWSHQNLAVWGLEAAGSVVLAGRSVLDARTGGALGELVDLAISGAYAVRPDVIVGYVEESPDRGDASFHLGAFDPVSRASRWRSPSLGPTTCSGQDVLLSDDVALLLSCDATDLAFDLATGAQLWTWPVGDEYRGVAASGTNFYRAQFDPGRGPLTDGGYRLTGITTIDAVDARSQARLWSAELEGEARSIRTFAGQLYAVDSSQVHAYDGADGTAQWTWDSPRPLLPDRIAGSGDQLVVAGHSFRFEDPDNTLLASVDASAGSTRWQLTLPEPPSKDPRAPVLVVAGNTVVAAAGSTVYAIATGGASSSAT